MVIFFRHQKSLTFISKNLEIPPKSGSSPPPPQQRVDHATSKAMLEDETEADLLHRDIFMKEFSVCKF